MLRNTAFQTGATSLVLGLCLVFALFASSHALAGDQVLKGPAESWVEFVDIPEADPLRNGQIAHGTSYLLTDNQARHTENGYDLFERFVYRIVDRPGLEDGAGINLEFDPSRHRVTLNRLHIIRDGVVLDRLAATKLDIFRQEKDAERGIFNGWFTARINIEDVRVGDVVDYATTYETTPTIGKGLFSTRMNTEWDVPLALYREKIVWPSSQPLEVKALRTDVKPTITSADASTVYLWEIANPAPVRSENNLPPDFSTSGSIEVSTAVGWQEIVDAVLPHYAPASSFPEAFATKLDSIARQKSSPEERLVAAMRLVQDEIRYVSLSIGAGSYIPRRPETVVESGFGDCKDKALLLVSALRRLGIEADVALADLDAGKGLYQRLPTLQAFDHAIVKAKIGQRVFWVDATNYLQGGTAENLVAPDYGYVLPLVSTGAVLEKITREAPLEPTIAVNEHFEFPRDEKDVLVLRITTIYRGADADDTRRRLARTPLTSLGHDYLEYYSKQYPGIRSLAGLIAKDDREANVLSITEAYQLPAADLASNLIKDFPLKADIGAADLPIPTAVGRTGPVWLKSAVFRSHKVTVTNLKGRFSGPPNADVVNPHVELRFNWSNTPSELEIEWKLKTLAEQVPGPAVSDYLQAAEKIGRHVQWNYDFTQQTPPVADFPAGLTAAAIGFVSSILCFLVMILREFRRREFPVGQEYWPISLWKFVSLSALTFGLYSLLWAWRAFRQRQAAGHEKIWPFWRAFFLPLWLLPAFLRANASLKENRLPLWIGIGAALAYFIAWVAGFVSEKLFGPDGEPPWVLALEWLVFSLAAVPLVVAVNRLNRDRPENQKRNSTISRWDMAGISASLVLLVSLVYLQFDETQMVAEAAAYSAAP